METRRATDSRGVGGFLLNERWGCRAVRERRERWEQMAEEARSDKGELDEERG